MDNFLPDDSQLKSLKTWYPVDNPLHFNPRHPCIKLAGEAGELLDLYGKEEYKPNFSWLDCKRCDHVHAHEYCGKVVGYSHITEEEIACQCLWYTPKVLDELGDYSYYLRILAYQKGVTFEELCEEFNLRWYSDDMLSLLAHLSYESATILQNYANKYSDLDRLELVACTGIFLAILHKLDCSLDSLLELNYRKLNSEESHHGWRDATIKNRA